MNRVGREIPEPEKEFVSKKLRDDYEAVPVYLSDDLADKHCENMPQLQKQRPQEI